MLLYVLLSTGGGGAQHSCPKSTNMQKNWQEITHAYRFNIADSSYLVNFGLKYLMFVIVWQLTKNCQILSCKYCHFCLRLTFLFLFFFLILSYHKILMRFESQEEEAKLVSNRILPPELHLETHLPDHTSSTSPVALAGQLGDVCSQLRSISCLSFF